MSNIIIQKEVSIENLNTNGTLTIYEEAQTAIDKRWDSLYFSENNVLFAKLEMGTISLRLITTGDVLIAPVDGRYEYTNKNEYEIRKLIDSKSLNEDDLYDNNWFEIYMVDNSSGEEQEVGFEIFELTPSSLETLEKDLVEYAVNFIENYM